MNNINFCILTIFPEMFPGSLQYSLAGKALIKNIWSYDIINIRDFGLTKHKTLDDKPYGGGHGLVMRADVLGAALDYALSKYPTSEIYYPSPRGKIFNQGVARKLAACKNVIILCGRFEGIDERLINEYNVQEISVGDYVLSGGEVAALSIMDATIRLIPGVLENSDTLKIESFEYLDEESIMLEHPLYTRPLLWKGNKVPDVLLSGHHKDISKWQLAQSITITAKRRPDLFLSTGKKLKE
ncbi:MAG: tRNA (guanosine(37)-N1)-methyltransferase TrmD [Rickettsiaceae bacterium]|nr:MAG: tRNA (guanosine(37)-N1)-methyltransferase TrmD [Rickettsiaceae bacterium]